MHADPEECIDAGLLPVESYRLAIGMVTDVTTLREYAEQVELDSRLRPSERDSLRSDLKESLYLMPPPGR